MTAAFPFSAIVGQEQMKLAMILTAIDPGIGGVLVFGDRGTGKSTVVRALAALLPPITAVEGCPVNSRQRDDCPDWAQVGPGRLVERPTPVVDLPLGVTEDRVTGALDIERALVDGQKRFQPGLLAQANRGYLYIDEVNLLEDHIVDLLLDVSQSGINAVEREGLSIRHPARFVLVGSGNPEEGELRPQLLDRFGLSVEVRSPDTIAERVEVVRRRDAYDTDQSAFLARWQGRDAAIRKAIVAARAALPTIAASDAILELCARISLALGADGLRGELTMLRAGRALAAYEAASAVSPGHLQRIAPMAMSHRLRRDPLDEAGSAARIDRALAGIMAEVMVEPSPEVPATVPA